MGRRLPPDQLEIYKRVDEILRSDWDPIGVHGIKEARDEYDGYLSQVFQMVLEGASTARIAQYLRHIVTERMGLTSSLSDHTAVAEKIHGLEKTR